MREAINRLHYLLTGVLATSATGTYTPCTKTGLTSCNVVVGWESLENDFTKIPYDKYPVIVIDLVQGTSESYQPHGIGEADGGYDRQLSLSIDLVVKSNLERSAIIGDTGILQLWNILDAFFRSDDCVYLTYGGNRYTSAMVWPRTVDDGIGADQNGRIFARARRTTLTWRELTIDA